MAPENVLPQIPLDQHRQKAHAFPRGGTTQSSPQGARLSLGPGLKPCLCNSLTYFCWKDTLNKPSLVSGSASGEPDPGVNQRLRVVK